MWGWDWGGHPGKEEGRESSSAQREKRRPQGSLCALRAQLRLARSVSMPAKLPSCYLICFISPKKFMVRSEKISKGLFTCSAPELDRKLKTFCKFKRKIFPLKFERPNLPSQTFPWCFIDFTVLNWLFRFPFWLLGKVHWDFMESRTNSCSPLSAAAAELMVQSALCPLVVPHIYPDPSQAVKVTMWKF